VHSPDHGHGNQHLFDTGLNAASYSIAGLFFWSGLFYEDLGWQCLEGCYGGLLENGGGGD